MIPISELRARAVAVDEMSSSAGWRHATDHLTAELLEFTKLLGTPPSPTIRPLSADEISFYRGAIFATTRFQSLPQLLLLKLQNDIALREATESSVTPEETAPAKAGEESS